MKPIISSEEKKRRYRKRQRILTIIGLFVVAGLIVLTCFTEGKPDLENY